MIASVSGAVQALEHGARVLEGGGVGLRVAVPDSGLEGMVRGGAGLAAHQAVPWAPTATFRGALIEFARAPRTLIESLGCHRNFDRCAMAAEGAI